MNNIPATNIINNNPKLEKMLEREKKIKEILSFNSGYDKDLINFTLTEQNIINKLRCVIDPELGVNIFDLGLIYDFRIEHNKVYIELTLTTIGCPLGNVIEDGITSMINEENEYDAVIINITFDPPWTVDSLPFETKLKLNFL